MNEWSNTLKYYKTRDFSVESLLKLLRCRGEDTIFIKYGVDIEQIYKCIETR